MFLIALKFNCYFASVIYEKLTMNCTKKNKCDPMPANEALCGKIKIWVSKKGQNFSKIKVCLKINFDINSMNS